MSEPAAAQVGPDQDDRDEGGIDPRLIRGYASFCRRALRVRWRLVAMCVLLTLAAAGGLLWAVSRAYHVSTSIVAQRDQVIAALGNPSRRGFGDADMPTKGAVDAVLRRDNLIALVKQTGLDKSWAATRSPFGRLSDAVRRLVRGPLTEDELIDALADLLERRMYVKATDAKIVIGINWPDAQMAYRLVAAAEQNFIEARHVTEISLIAESISILESHAAVAREEVERCLQDVRSRPQPRAVWSTPAPADGAAPVDEETSRLAVLLTAKRRAIRDLEDFRRRRLNELQAELAEQKAIYAGSHPNIIAIEESIRGLMDESPQLTALQQEAQEIENEYRRRGGRPLRDPDPTAGAAASAPRLPVAQPLVLERGTRDAADDFARQRLSAATARYDTLLDRIAGARVELDAARAAFKYRYVIVRPPKHPRHPERPRAPLVLAGGGLAGILLGVAAAVLVEARRGLVVQAWQVESLLGLGVLAEVRSPHQS